MPARPGPGGTRQSRTCLRRFQGKAGRLWLIWSGHGIVRERERFAFLANYCEDDRNVLNIETLQGHLQTAALRCPGDQVLVFDTCGTVFDEYKFQQTLAYQMFGKGEVNKSCRQFLMFASEDGTVAVNRQGVGGTFTAELLASLKSLNPDKPADLHDVHERMLLRFEDLRLRDPKVQRPIRVHLAGARRRRPGECPWSRTVACAGVRLRAGAGRRLDRHPGSDRAAPRSEPALAGCQPFQCGPARVQHADQERHRERL